MRKVERELEVLLVSLSYHILIHCNGEKRFWSTKYISLVSQTSTKTGKGVLLLLSSCEAYDAPRQRRAGVGTSDTSIYSQQLSIKASDRSDCSAVGKCRPCSWLDMNRELRECLVSGFKQRSYCRDIKRESYTSCHYVPDAQEVRVFWLFEGSVSLIGILSYASVLLRNRKIERRTARRIQEQINA